MQVNLLVLAAVAFQLFQAQSKLNKLMRTGSEKDDRNRNFCEKKTLALLVHISIYVLWND